MEGNSTKCKIVLLGDQSVGKTSIINRFIFDNFTGNQQPTVGVDFVSKTVNVQAKSLRMQLWDTAGQQRFHSLIPSYIKDCNAAVIVFDITNNNSYNNLSKWIDNVRQVRGDDALILILGNKKDLDDQRSVDSNSAHNQFKQLGITYMEVSAKTGLNIKEFFKDLSIMIVMGNKKVQKQQNNTKALPPSQYNQQKQPNVQLSVANSTENKKEKKKCCG